MNLPGREKFESKIARDIMGVSAEHRHELFTLMGFPPDIGNVPQEFWDRLEDEKRSKLIPLLGAVFLASAVLHGAKVQDATNQAKEFGLRHGTDIAKAAVTGVIDYLRPVDEDDDLTEKVFNALSPNKAEITAINGVTKASFDGGEWAVKKEGKETDEDWWMVALGPDGRPAKSVCRICIGLYKLTRKEWSQFVPMGPPVHPRCQCWIKYRNEGNL